MDYNQACKLLDLKKGFSPPQLKKAYYKKALEFHPDKNSETEEEFKEIGMAYVFLQKNKKMKIEDLSYAEILKKIFNMDLLLFKHKKPMEIIFQKDFSLKIFDFYLSIFLLHNIYIKYKISWQTNNIFYN